MAKPKTAAAKPRRNAGAKISVELDYAEASLVVVATNLLFGAAAGRDGPDAQTTRTLGALLHKLYVAEPRLKADARRVETEMRNFLIQDTDEADEDADDEDAQPPLKGGNMLSIVMAAMEKGRAVPLMRSDCVFNFFPTGAGEIGDVAVAIGWSPAHNDYTLVRMDEVLGVGLESPPARPAAVDPTAATLARLCPKPPIDNTRR